MLLSDEEIKHLCQDYLMIDPYSPKKNTLNGVSWGSSSYGYDIRLGEQFIRNIGTPNEEGFVLEKGEVFELAPMEFILAKSLEHFNIPSNIQGTIKDKSTWARKGLMVINGVLEPKWMGQVTLEIINLSPSIINLTPGLGIAQVVFMTGKPCSTTYHGLYQNSITIIRSQHEEEDATSRD